MVTPHVEPARLSRRSDAVAWAAPRERATPGSFIPTLDKTERRMVVAQWLIMPLVLAGSALPWAGTNQPASHVAAAAALMALHPLLYLLVARLPWPHTVPVSAWRDAALTATDVTIATLVFYATVARPGYAQVLLYCTVALAATRYTVWRAVGITSLVALLLVFTALLPLDVAPPILASEILSLYALTYLVGLLSQAEKAVSAAATVNARLAQTVLQRNRELGALNGLARTLNADLAATGVLQLGIQGVTDALQLGMLRAYLVDESGLALVAHAGGPDGGRDEAGPRCAQWASTAAAAQRTNVESWTGQAGTTVCVSVPLFVHGAVGAVIQAEVKGDAAAVMATTGETLEIFCDEIAVALENALLRTEARRIAILREKNRIAQELHDTVLQLLFSVGLRLQSSIDRAHDDDELREHLTEARHLSARAGRELRGAIFTLSSDIAEIGLVDAVQRLVTEQAEQAGWTANVTISGTSADLPVLVQNAAHRVVREGLMNAYKHAHATEVMVALRFGDDTLTVVVRDNGVGIPDATLHAFRADHDHFGLRTVADQIAGLGGQLHVDNDDEHGVVVKATLPLERGQLVS